MRFAKSCCFVRLLEGECGESDADGSCILFTMAAVLGWTLSKCWPHLGFGGRFFGILFVSLFFASGTALFISEIRKEGIRMRKTVTDSIPVLDGERGDGV